MDRSGSFWLPSCVHWETDIWLSCLPCQKTDPQPGHSLAGTRRLGTVALSAANPLLQHVDPDLMSGTPTTPHVSHCKQRTNTGCALTSLLMCCLIALCGDATTPASGAAPTAPPFDWSTVDSQPEQAAHILRQLRAWRKPDPARSKKYLRVVYFHPQDRQPLKRHIDRWHQIMVDIRQFYRDEMRTLGYGDITLALEQNQGKLKLHQVQGTANDDGSYSYRSGNRIYNEIVKVLAHKGIDAQRETLLIVCGLSVPRIKRSQSTHPTTEWVPTTREASALWRTQTG